MKQTNRKWMAAVAAAGVIFASSPVFAAMPLMNVVTGTVTGVGSDQVIVDGKKYSVDVQGSALQQLEQIHAGEQVQLILNGPPNSAAARVESIQVHRGS